MKQISSMDLFYLVKDFQVLVDQRIDNFYFEEGTFYIRVYVRTKGHMYLTNKVSKFIYLDKEKDDASEPNNFIQHLRKYLKNGFVRAIEQVENERIVKITISKKDTKEQIENYYLYLELFANGNIVLCDQNNKIKNSLEKRKFKDRDVLVNRDYELPPARDLNIHNIDDSLLRVQLDESDLTIVKFLAIKFGLGGKFSEEVCTLTNIDKNTKTVDLKDTKSLTKTLKEILKKKVEANIVDNKDFFPFKFKSVEGEVKDYKTFNDAIREYFSSFKEEVDRREESFQKELKKLQKRLEKLEEQKEQVLEDYDKYNGYGNKIYEGYSEVEELLNSINKAAKEKGWDHVKEVIKSNDKLNKKVKKLNYKNNEIVLDL